MAMSTPADFKTLDGPAWHKALAKARERRNGQGKRVAEAVARYAKGKQMPKIHLHISAITPN